MTRRPAAAFVSPPDPATLDAMLTRLKLTAIRDQLDTLLAEAARRELTLIETVAYLCEREIARKDARRIDMALGLARWPIAPAFAAATAATVAMHAFTRPR